MPPWDGDHSEYYFSPPYDRMSGRSNLGEGRFILALRLDGAVHGGGEDMLEDLLLA